MSTFTVPKALLDEYYSKYAPEMQKRIDQAVTTITNAKKEHQKICVVTGSGPNIHEGITTLIAELIRKGIIDSVLTSSAVISHEMAGSLDKVKRINGSLIKHSGMKAGLWLPKGDIFELTLLTPAEKANIIDEMHLNADFIAHLESLEGQVIIKAAGNMAYPMGLRTEMLSEEILKIAEKLKRKYCLEQIAGLGCDPLTMIGAAARRNVPVMVSIPQMVGGGGVGLCVGDSISVHDRCQRNAKALGDASIIIESGLALAQEIHDGPFETYTGHGIWSQWQDHPVYSLHGKHLIRFDLDQNLDTVWQQQRNAGLIQAAIAEGKPKTKLTGVPFRMEMSGFARLETSLPIIGDIGSIWPIIAMRVAENLNISLDFLSCPQENPRGQEMRQWIVDNVKMLDKQQMLKEVAKLE
jgi:hypothetical protein